MFIGDCRKYPDCHYDINKLDNLIAPKAINQMSIWTTDIDKSSTIGNEKYVIVAYCEDDGNDKNEYCEFETSIFSKSQDIYLIEEEKFSKYLIEGEQGKFIIDLNNGRQIKAVLVDIMIFSGDVTFNCSFPQENIDFNYYKNYMSNKVLINYNIWNLGLERLILEYSAKMNSFFTIQYEILIDSYSQLEEKVPSGESYLVQIDPYTNTKTKTVYLLNQFYKNKNPFLTNFFALNCEFEVTI